MSFFSRAPDVLDDVAQVEIEMLTYCDAFDAGGVGKVMRRVIDGIWGRNGLVPHGSAICAIPGFLKRIR